MTSDQLKVQFCYDCVHQNHQILAEKLQPYIHIFNLFYRRLFDRKLTTYVYS